MSSYRNRNRRNDPTRVGIDFGGTIGFVDQEQPIPHAFEMIQHLIHKYGANNVFVVSKAGTSMVEKTQAWFHKSKFFQQTGFLPENVIFVRGCQDKADVVKELNISIFLDDSTKVVRCLAPLPMVARIFWMSAKSEYIQMIEKKDRHKIAITKSWASTMKYFQNVEGVEKEQES